MCSDLGKDRHALFACIQQLREPLWKEKRSEGDEKLLRWAAKNLPTDSVGARNG